LINRFLFTCFYLVFRVLARWYPPTPQDLKREPLERILVFSAAGIGDTLTDSPAIRALKETFPRSTITVVTHRRRSILVEHNPLVDQVVLYHKSLFRFFSLRRELREFQPNVIVMLRGNDPDLWPLAYSINRHAVVSCRVMTRFSFLISHPVSIPAWDQTHGVEQTLEIVRALGADTRNRRLVYQVEREEEDRVREKLDAYFPHSRPLVIFQVGGGRRSAWRDWPEQNFIGLAQRLLAQYDINLILLGGQDLSQKGRTIHLALPERTLNLAGLLTLEESAALLSMAKILVSTDTGIMHLGFAVGVDTLAMIHCNNPASRVGPYDYGEQHRVVQLQPPPGTRASKKVPMSLLTVDEVWTQLEFLAERKKLPKMRA
jgi:ADP-heptose:LPS heptosyltransferase